MFSKDKCNETKVPGKKNRKQVSGTAGDSLTEVAVGASCK